jgi:hypothetical protein
MTEVHVMVFGWNELQWSHVETLIPLGDFSMGAFIKAKYIWKKARIEEPIEAAENPEVTACLLNLPATGLNTISDANIRSLDAAHKKVTAEPPVNRSSYCSEYSGGGFLTGLAVGIIL